MTRDNRIHIIAAIVVGILTSIGHGASRSDGPTLVDLAVAYLALDRAVATHPIPAAERAAVNVSVDMAAGYAFGRRGDLAVDRFRTIAAERVARNGAGEGRRLAHVRTRVEPPAHVRRSPPPVLRLVAPVPRAGAIGFRLRAADGAIVLTGAVPADRDRLPLPGLDDLDAGRYELELGADDTGWILADACTVLDAPPSDLLAWGRAALEGLPPHLDAPRAACAARLALLGPGSPDVDVTRWALDRARIQREVMAEIESLQRDVDPYTGRAGDTWMVIPAGDVEIPCRVFAPPAKDDRARPLVVALHGVGGNEHMFMDAYGGGLLQRIAEREDFILVAPLTYPLAGDPSCLTALLERVEAMHAVDRDRVYLIGHSLGAMTAARLAAMYPERIAAMCCIAGAGQAAGAADLPPAAFFAAELDRMVPSPVVRAVYDRALANGRDVTYRLVPDHGHVLIVGAVLPDAMTWLLAR